MSISKESFALLPPSDNAPLYVQETSCTNTEMTSPLTSEEGDNTISTSSSSNLSRDMSSYQPGGLGSGPSHHHGHPSFSGRSNMTSGLAATWRREGAPSPVDPDNENAGYYPTMYDPANPSMHLSAAAMQGHGPGYQSRPQGNSFMMEESVVPLSSIRPGSVWPTNNQLDTAYGYGIQRDDGSVTRLICADQISEYLAMPPRQGPEGLILLPQPRQYSPNRRGGAEPMVPIEVSRSKLSLFMVTHCIRLFNSCASKEKASNTSRLILLK